MNEAGFVELIPMRSDERIDPESVSRFLEGKLPNIGGIPEIRQFEGGKANLTYLLRYPRVEYVLRRPPLGPIAPRSHDMAREYKVLSRLYQKFPLAPRAFLYSAEESIVGAPFLVMERRKGQVIRQRLPAGFADDPALNRRLSAMIVETLAALHKVEPHQVGLEDLGRPDGFMARQIRGWAGRWDAAKTAELPAFDQVRRWLEGNLPPEPTPGLVHNDFKLDNMMVGLDDPALPVAVLDWDMCTLGDPLADLGTLLGYWTEMGDDSQRRSFAVMPTGQEGFFTRAEVVEHYAKLSSRSLEQIGFYEVFGIWKTAVIVQQIYVRWVRGQTKDARFTDYGQRVSGLVQAALASIE